MNKNKIIFLSVIILISIFFAVFILKLKSKKEENFVQPKPFKEISPKNSDCIRSGCSGEVCQEKGKEPIYSTCLYHPRYECYQLAKCERQPDGRCGFTFTEEFKKCLEKYFGPKMDFNNKIIN